MLKENESLFVGSATDVAVMVGEAAAPLGAVAGGAYEAERLGEAAGVRVPQVPVQSTPPTVKVQESPAFVKSFVIVAFTGTAEAPTAIVLNLLVMETDIGGATIVKLKLSDLVGSTIEEAAIVGEAFAPLGGMVGGL